MSNDKQTYPTEIVKLPSKGLLYSKENGLSNGEIEIRYPTAKEEDILTSRNLIKQGVAMDMFLKSLIESKNVNYEDLYVGDRDALLMASRILAYSSQYTFEYTCPYCGEKSKVSKDLNDFDDKEIDWNLIKLNSNEFEYELKYSKNHEHITFKLLTVRDLKQIDNTIKRLKKLKMTNNVDPEMTTRLKQMIVSVNGDDSPKIVNQLAETMLTKDAHEFRQHIVKVSPGIEFRVLIMCPSCGEEEVRVLPMDINFFWPGAEL